MVHRYSLAVLMMVCVSTTLFSQNASSGPAEVIQGVFLGEVPSINEQIANGTFVPAADIHGEVNEKRMGANKTVPGKGFPQGLDPIYEKNLRKEGTSATMANRDPLLVFDVSNPNATPSDPTGAVGPDHYVAAWNSAFRIFNKDGDALTGAASLATIWPGESSGDPIVMYDSEADRFFISQFFFNGFLVAVSTGPDPTEDSWYTYQFPTTSFPDYPKYSIWSDGYYVTANIGGQQVFSMDREKILAGDPSATMQTFTLPGIATSGFYSPLGFSVVDENHPPAGDFPIIYMQDDAWGGVGDDHLKIWTIDVDWDTPGNSSIEESQEIITEDFDSVFDGGSFANITQPNGVDIDCLQATIMYMASYRRFPGHNSCVLNFVVDLDGGDELAGIRWYELRQYEDGGDWEIYQEGTYAQPDGHSAFNASISIDSSGNIGLGYTACSTELAVSLRYTGWMSGGTLGEMNVDEAVFVTGGGSTNFFRYGDYSQLTVDPVDDKTFWYVGEHFTSSGGRVNTVGTWQLAPVHDDDTGVVDVVSPTDGLLTDEETITITVRNYGILTQSDIPVWYSINGGAQVMETFPGPIASQENIDFTFATTANLDMVGEIYSIEAGTDLALDADENNDDYEEEVAHLLPDDVGVTAILAPMSATDLAVETISIQVENFGGASQTDVPVMYSIDGGAPVMETVPGTIAPQTTATFDFAAQGDFSAFADFEITSATELDGDMDESNDATTITITHDFCQPGGNCGFGDGFQSIQLVDINNNSGCDEEGYGDYTNLSTGLALGEEHIFSMTTGYGDQFITVWIDFNDNFQFEDNEKVIDDFLVAEGEAGGEYSADIPFTIADGTALGEHIMRCKSNWQAGVPDACEEVTYGETEDYTVELLPVGIDESELGKEALKLVELTEDQFMLTFETIATTDVLIFELWDVNGRLLMRNRVPNNGGMYQFDFDMSYAAAGAYLVKLGNAEVGKVKRFIVR